jgi:hypothetical protein
MALRGIFAIARSINDDRKKKKITELLRERGFSEDNIKYAHFAIDYLSLSEKDKKKVYKGQTLEQRAQSENAIKLLLIHILQYEDIALLVYPNQKEALESHNYAVEAIKRMKSTENST